MCKYYSKSIKRMIDYIWEKNKKHWIYRWFFWIQLFWIVANGGDIMPDISNRMRTSNTLASQLISSVKTRCSILMRHNEFVSRLKSTRQPFFRLFVVLAQHCEIMSTTRIPNTWHALALEHVCFLVCSFVFFSFLPAYAMYGSSVQQAVATAHHPQILSIVLCSLALIKKVNRGEFRSIIHKI